MHRVRLIVPVLIAMLLLAACGGTPAAESPTAAPQPTERPAPTERPEPTERPTPRPRPTARPTEEPEPTEEPTEEPEPTSSATGSLMELEVGDLQTYSHPNGLFTIEVPENWTLEDKSKETETILLWTDPSGNGFIVVDLFESETAMDNDALTELLENFLTNSFQNEPDFRMDPAEVEEIGDIRIVWSYTGTASNGVQAKLLGNSFIEQKENKVSLMTIVLPNDQFDSLKPELDEILNSYSYDPSVAINAQAEEPTSDGQLKPVELGDLETYTHENGLFSIDIPNNWTITDNSKTGEAIVLWLDPTQNALVSVDIFEEATEQTDDDLTELLQNFLNNSFGSNQDFSMDDPKPQSDGSILIVWSYTADVSGIQAKLLGNSFVEQRDNKISILSTLVPNDQFETLLTDTNKIINSYSLDTSAEVP